MTCMLRLHTTARTHCTCPMYIINSRYCPHASLLTTSWVPRVSALHCPHARASRGPATQARITPTTPCINTPYCRVTPHHRSPHHVTPHHMPPRHVTPHHMSPRHVTPHHMSLHHVTPHHPRTSAARDGSSPSSSSPPRDVTFSPSLQAAPDGLCPEETKLRRQTGGKVALWTAVFWSVPMWPVLAADHTGAAVSEFALDAPSSWSSFNAFLADARLFMGKGFDLDASSLVSNPLVLVVVGVATWWTLEKVGQTVWRRLVVPGLLLLGCVIVAYNFQDATALLLEVGHAFTERPVESSFLFLTVLVLLTNPGLVIVLTALAAVYFLQPALGAYSSAGDLFHWAEHQVSSVMDRGRVLSALGEGQARLGQVIHSYRDKVEGQLSSASAAVGGTFAQMLHSLPAAPQDIFVPAPRDTSATPSLQQPLQSVVTTAADISNSAVSNLGQVREGGWSRVVDEVGRSSSRAIGGVSKWLDERQTGTPGEAEVGGTGDAVQQLNGFQLDGYVQRLYQRLLFAADQLPEFPGQRVIDKKLGELQEIVPSSVKESMENVLGEIGKLPLDQTMSTLRDQIPQEVTEATQGVQQELSKLQVDQKVQQLWSKVQPEIASTVQSLQDTLTDPEISKKVEQLRDELPPSVTKATQALKDRLSKLQLDQAIKQLWKQLPPEVSGAVRGAQDIVSGPAAVDQGQQLLPAPSTKAAPDAAPETAPETAPEAAPGLNDVLPPPSPTQPDDSASGSTSTSASGVDAVPAAQDGREAAVVEDANTLVEPPQQASPEATDVDRSSSVDQGSTASQTSSVDHGSTAGQPSSVEQASSSSRVGESAEGSSDDASERGAAGSRSEESLGLTPAVSENLSQPPEPVSTDPSQVTNGGVEQPSEALVAPSTFDGTPLSPEIPLASSPAPMESQQPPAANPPPERTPLPSHMELPDGSSPSQQQAPSDGIEVRSGGSMQINDASEDGILTPG